MNTGYQAVAAGTITPLNAAFAESINEPEVQKYRDEREKWLKKIEGLKAGVGVTTEFPDYRSLGETWRHQAVERVYDTVVACISSRLKESGFSGAKLVRKKPAVYLSWDRLHHNESGKPVYIQRWYIAPHLGALLGTQGRLGEACLADVVLTAWLAEAADAKSSRTDRWSAGRGSFMKYL